MVEHVMPLCLTISWVYSVAMLVQSIVYEKERRLKEVLYCPFKCPCFVIINGLKDPLILSL